MSKGVFFNQIRSWVRCQLLLPVRSEGISSLSCTTQSPQSLFRRRDCKRYFSFVARVEVVAEVVAVSSLLCSNPMTRGQLPFYGYQIRFSVGSQEQWNDGGDFTVLSLSSQSLSSSCVSRCLILLQNGKHFHLIIGFKRLNTRKKELHFLWPMQTTH